ncbi:DUF932 domain-containing protein [Arcicella sp. LKC2W]|uniref:DUF932 domain-containing protein n=1 Tax=Arcicella sp. LKC2W TaxID=2984198 RepID=UPI002B21F9DB|nr:DUF932 domain-containing protein [Arcicella sp. LKC2W]MEA5459111.1 DUF932 domain-containing protein [Arcicella sp. LKC2W]
MQTQSLNWDVIERPIFSNFKQVNGYKAIYRSDTDELLHIAKNSYTPTTNERFLETVYRLSQITGYPVELYDEIAGGKKTLAFLKCLEPSRINGYDFKDYLLIGNSHDGSTGFFVGNSNIMVRCENRFTKQFRQIQINHTKNHSFKIDSLAGSFSNYTRQRQRFYDEFAEYIDFEIVEEDKQSLVNLIADVTPHEREDNKLISTRKNNIIRDINESIRIETNELGNNLFGLFNGITHNTTHTRKQKEASFCNAIGTNAELNAKTLNFCQNLIEIRK